MNTSSTCSAKCDSPARKGEGECGAPFFSLSRQRRGRHAAAASQFFPLPLDGGGSGRG